MADELEKLITRYADWAVDRAAVYADASKELAANMAKNKGYTGEALTDDVAKAVARLADDWSTLLAALTKPDTT